MKNVMASSNQTLPVNRAGLAHHTGPNRAVRLSAPQPDFFCTA